MTQLVIALGLAAVVLLGLGARRLRDSRPIAARWLGAGMGIVVCAEGIALFVAPGLFGPHGIEFGPTILGALFAALGVYLAFFMWRLLGHTGR